MINLVKYLSILLFVAVFVSCDKDDSSEDFDDKNFKLYDIESGIIKYATTTSGTVASGSVTGTGTAQLYFKKWGAVGLDNEEYAVTTKVTIPISNHVVIETDHVHNTVLTEYEMYYEVDYDAKVIYSQETPIVAFMRLYNYDAHEAGKQSLIAAGGKQLDNEKYRGYDCEVWTALASKTWIHKGVILKLITTLGGITITKEAVDIKFDVPVSDTYFELPDYKITPINGLMN